MNRRGFLKVLFGGIVVAPLAAKLPEFRIQTKHERIKAALMKEPPFDIADLADEITPWRTNLSFSVGSSNHPFNPAAYVGETDWVNLRDNAEMNWVKLQRLSNKYAAAHR